MSWDKIARGGMLAVFLACAGQSPLTVSEDPQPLEASSETADASTDFYRLKRDGLASLRARDPHRAVTLLRAALKLQPDDSETVGALGQALFLLGQNDEAIENLRRASDLAPGDIRPRSALARLFKSLGRYDEAAIEYQEVLKIYPDHRGALGELGDIGFKTGDYEKCVEYFTKFIAATEGEATNLLTERDKHLYRRAKEQLASCQSSM